ncbi:MAG: hypothetical protein GC160_05410 [Acidobacteria bacterium]|nr:hypothetical protein [Acidobacteriota bacterium]
MPRPVQLVRIAMAGLLALATLEVSARVDDWITHGAPLWGSYDIERIYEYDSLGRRGKPNASYLKWKLNDQGFRGPNFETDKLTVATFGASETFGLYEAEDREYPRQLEEVLRQRLGSDAVQVANVAYPGITVGQSLLRLDETLDAVRPDLAVLYPSVAGYIEYPDNGEWRLGRAPAPSRIPPSRLAERVRELLKRSIPEWIQTTIRARQAEQASGDEDVWKTIPEGNVDGFRRDLDRFLDALAQRRIPVALVTHATRFGDAVRPEERFLLVAWRKFYPQLAEDGFLDMERRLNKVVREAARERGLPLIDAAREMPPGPEDFVEFVHFTDAGSHRMAKLIADGIEAPLAARLEQRSAGARVGNHNPAPKQLP